MITFDPYDTPWSVLVRNGGLSCVSASEALRVVMDSWRPGWAEGDGPRVQIGAYAVSREHLVQNGFHPDHKLYYMVVRREQKYKSAP